jgi:hypothetical protein
VIPFAFLGYPESAGKWLLLTDRVPAQILNDLIGALIGVLVVGLILRPAVNHFRGFIGREWAEHKDHQRRLVDSNERIADALNTSTPGGLTDVVSAVKRRSS